MVQSRDNGEKKRPNAAQYSGVKANFMVMTVAFDTSDGQIKYYLYIRENWY